MAAFPSLGQIPGLPDMVRRCRVPDDLESVTDRGSEVDPADADLTEAAVEEIWSKVTGLYRSGVHPALAVCLRRNGQVVLDRAIGHTRGNAPGGPDDAERVPVSVDTPFCLYSATKAVTAMVVHLLDERGLLHVGDRVADYVPEFAAHGKDAITIAHVLSHRAGVPSVPRDVLDLDNLDDRELRARVLSEARPISRPGRMVAYHALSGGFIMGEVVERVTGRPIEEVLRTEILDPLGFERLDYGVPPEDLALVAEDALTGLPVRGPIAWFLERAVGLPFGEVVEAGNDPRFLTGVIPAGNGCASARELSRFFELLRRGGELDGVRIFDERTVRRAVAEQSWMEIDLTLGLPNRYSMGFMLGGKRLSLYGPDTRRAFGHNGFTYITGWADPERGLSAAILSSGKAVVYPEVLVLADLMLTIGREIPKLSDR